MISVTVCINDLTTKAASTPPSIEAVGASALQKAGTDEQLVR